MKKLDEVRRHTRAQFIRHSAHSNEIALHCHERPKGFPRIDPTRAILLYTTSKITLEDHDGLFDDPSNFGVDYRITPIQCERHAETFNPPARRLKPVEVGPRTRVAIAVIRSGDD